MTNNIPSDIEINNWYRETSKHPEFIETLTTYQKAKLLEYCNKENDNIFSFAYRHLGVWNETNFPKELPEKDQLKHIVTVNQAPALYIVIKVLNALNYSWSFQEGIKSLNNKPEEPSLENEEKENTIQAEFLTLDGKQCFHSQIALFIIYKNYKTNLHDPRRTSNTWFHKLAPKFGFTSPTSPELIFYQWNKRKDNLTQRLGHKKEINVKKDIETILHLLEPKEQKEALKDIETLNLRIN